MAYELTNTAEFLTVLQRGKIRENEEIRLGSKLDIAEGVQALATALRSGQCPRGLVIMLSNKEVREAHFQALATALQSGQCPQELKLYLGGTRVNRGGVQALATALQSGQCPPGLQLHLEYNSIDNFRMQALATALQSGRCPEGLKIDLRGVDSFDNIGIQALATALQSGQCPKKLQIDLSRSDIGDIEAQTLATALQSPKCPPGLKLSLRGNEISAVGAQAIAQAILSESCPLILDANDIFLLNIDLKAALKNLLDIKENLQELGASSSSGPNNETQQWPAIFTAIRRTLGWNPEILVDNEVRQTIQEVLEHYIRELQANNEEFNKDEYCEAYFPVFKEVAEIILAICDVSQTATTEQKRWASTLMLTLADSILPQQPIDWPPELSLWANAQRLIMIEKAFSLCPDNPNVLARHWQYFCDEFNDVPQEKRTFEQEYDLKSIKEKATNASAIQYYNQIRTNGLIVLPKLEHEPTPSPLGKRKREEFEPELAAGSAKTDFFKKPRESLDEMMPSKKLQKNNHSPK